MSNPVTRTYRKTKRFVSKHRVGIAVVATTVVMAKIARHAQAEQINFIKDKGLWQEFLNPEAVAEALSS